MDNLDSDSHYVERFQLHSMYRGWLCRRVGWVGSTQREHQILSGAATEEQDGVEELNNIIIVFVITVHRSYLISAKDRLLDSWNGNDENVGDMIYMSGCRQEEEEEGDGEHDEK